MRRLRFVTADVFTPSAFSGNPLAVVFGAEGLPDAALQAVALEFNLSETTFVLPPEAEGTVRRVRIFTPEVEAAHVLAATGEVNPTDAERAAREMTLVLGEGVGPVRVRVALNDEGKPLRGQLTVAQPPEERVEVADAAAIAGMLSLEASDLSPLYSPTGVSCGLPFLVVPLASTAAVSRARLDTVAWQGLLADKWASWPMIFALRNPDEDDSHLPPHVRGYDIRVRVFIPESSVPEDPATGSAAACLAAYLAKRAPTDGIHRWDIAQGIEMGRASRIAAEAERRGGEVAAVRVGGASVLISEGTMLAPEVVL
ncbi:hypothetical protein DFJ74DRAFT_755897 [Hyaloraphidium curvatum]|nr:hypothetical protein DFJ74DRAFT_755897 [Hyaloraphidium curvatum]